MSMFGRTHNQVSLIGFAADKATFTSTASGNICVIKIKTFDEYQNEDGQWSYDIDWHRLLIKKPLDLKTSLQVKRSTQLLALGTLKIMIDNDVESGTKSSKAVIVVNSLQILEREFTAYEQVLMETMEYDDEIDRLNAPALSHKSVAEIE